eukprot:TRINITY_DN12360_c0_g2_i8.p1 TRINITY_DN12360_c0_g2~~TRINITY_DN12360_c0_g2_i8.p1  ORF type:complete len:535 (+),score=85.83 TRINITY_DN12360_c0_g2_i8:2-1606(+)
MALRICNLVVFGLAWSASSRTCSSYDVIVYGTSASGVAAAITAARFNHSVAIVGPEIQLGGMMTGGLGATDIGFNASVIGGIAFEFFQRVCIRSGARHQNPCFHFPPSFATAAFNAMMAGLAPSIDVHLETQLVETTKSDTLLTAITVTKGNKSSCLGAKGFIDASYEGDLLASSGVPYHIGREAASVYNESLAGRIATDLWQNSNFQWPVSAIDLNGTLRPEVTWDSNEALGTGDAKVQAYNFRLCWTQDRRNQLPFTPPDGYNESTFQLLGRYLQEASHPTLNDCFIINELPDNKTDINNGGPFSTDYIGHSWAYPNASFAQRSAIVQEHEHYTKSLIWYLLNSTAVPASIRAELAQWGWCADEFQATGGFPPQIYVREARRMRSDFVFTQHDRLDNRTKSDSIGLGDYNMDAHHVERIAINASDGSVHARNEGCISGYRDANIRKPFQIPYRVLTPPAAIASNLLVSAAVSASHVGYGCLRLEPQYMIMGQAAATAMTMAIDAQTAVQDIRIAELQSRLADQGGRLHFDTF